MRCWPSARARRWPTRWRRSTPRWPSRSPTLRDTIAGATDLWDIRAENARLRDENERLRRWQSIALALDAENQRLKANLHWIPDPAPSYVTARVVADAGGVYAKAVLLSVGPNHGVRKGEIALDERGLVGRVTEVGARTARVLLITDLNSRIPVILENSRAHAILVGTNGARPRLTYWPEGAMPQEGERVVTSAEASAFPANLPVGTVHFSTANVPEVAPAAMLDRLEVVRIFDYGLGGIAAPEAPGRLAGTARALMARADQTPGIRPRATLGRRLDIAARHAFPAGCTILLMLLTEAPLRHRRPGDAAAGGHARLRVFLVAVPPRCDAAAGGVPDRPAVRPAGLSAARRRPADAARRAWPGAALAPGADAAGVPDGLARVRGVRRRRRGARLGADRAAVVPPAAARAGAVPGGADRGAVSRARRAVHPRPPHRRRSGARRDARACEHP